MTKGSSQVLVVDDEPHLRNILRDILTAAGYNVVTAADGESALQKVSKKAPDVVLLDLVLPGIDGREVCRQLRNLDEKIKIIYFTGKAESFNRPGVRELLKEADGIVTKPATKRQILTKLNSVLQQRG